MKIILEQAEGEIIEVLGNINKFGVDVMCMVKEHNLPFEFPEFVLDEANKMSDTVKKSELKNRADLRNKKIFTRDN